MFQKTLIIIFLCTSLPVFSNQQESEIMKLKPCPDSPNCVSSQSTDKEHFIQPISYATNADEALLEIKTIILALPRTRLVSENNQSLHFEFKSRFLKFVDDVDIIINDANKVMDIRSASRTGYSDFGVNRKRVEIIRKNFITDSTPNISN